MAAPRARVILRACLAAAACAAGCQGYGLHVSLDTPDTPPPAATAAPAPAAPAPAAAAAPDSTAPPAEAAAPALPPPAPASPGTPQPGARERAAQLAELYREWRASSAFLARRLDAGLETPAVVREELMNLSAQLLALAPLLDDPHRTDVRACAEEYGPLADRHGPGRSRETSVQLRTLSRRIQRILE